LYLHVHYVIKKKQYYCLYNSTHSQQIWKWFQELWRNITQETISLTEDKLWIFNDRESKYPRVLAEIIDNVQYSIWVHRNEHTFRPHPIVPINVTIIGIAQQLNTLIRSRDHLNLKKRDEKTSINSAKYIKMHWTEVWQQIKQLQINTPAYKELQNCEGDEQLVRFLYNKVADLSNFKNNKNVEVLSLKHVNNKEDNKATGKERIKNVYKKRDAKNYQGDSRCRNVNAF